MKETLVYCLATEILVERHYPLPVDTSNPFGEKLGEISPQEVEEGLGKYFDFALFNLVEEENQWKYCLKTDLEEQDTFIFLSTGLLRCSVGYYDAYSELLNCEKPLLQNIMALEKFYHVCGRVNGQDVGYAQQFSDCFPSKAQNFKIKGFRYGDFGGEFFAEWGGLFYAYADLIRRGSQCKIARASFLDYKIR